MVHISFAATSEISGNFSAPREIKYRIAEHILIIFSSAIDLNFNYSKSDC